MDPANVGGARVALVSEVLDRLLAEQRGDSPRRAALYQAALQACAEESRRVKRGGSPAPVAVLVERARAILVAPSRPGPSTTPVSPAPPPPPPAHPEEQSGTSGEDLPSRSPAELLPERAPDPAPPAGSRRTSRVALLAGLGPLILVAVVGYLFLRARMAPFGGRQPAITEIAPPPGMAARDTATPAPSAPPTLAPPVPPVMPAEAAVAGAPPQPPPTAVAGGSGEAPAAPIMTSSEWSGRAPTFVIHFSSYREAEKARRDAAELALRYHLPARAVRVELPGGAWYRVLLGDFPSAAAARAFRDQLAAAGTPELGGVYVIQAP